MFIHIGIYHITYNVLTQLLLGLPLELVHQWRVIVVYLAGVLSGSLLVSAVDPHVFLAGASGGVYALLAAHLAELIMNWREMEFNWIRAIILVILIGADTAVSVYQRYFVDRVDRVSYVSHIGGFVAGILLGVVILRNFRRHKWEARLWWASLVAFVFFIVICIVLIIAPDIVYTVLSQPKLEHFTQMIDFRYNISVYESRWIMTTWFIESILEGEVDPQ
nr:Peptidase S54 domain containing protein [Haemonchus contortus]